MKRGLVFVLFLICLWFSLFSVIKLVSAIECGNEICEEGETEFNCPRDCVYRYNSPFAFGGLYYRTEDDPLRTAGIKNESYPNSGYFKDLGAFWSMGIVVSWYGLDDNNSYNFMPVDLALRQAYKGDILSPIIRNQILPVLIDV